MSEQAESRRLRLLEKLAEKQEPRDLDALAEDLACDSRTIRRDLDYLQQLIGRIQGIEVRRGKVHIARSGYSPGYFTDQLSRNMEAKEAIARAIVSSLPDDLAIALTAGSTPFAVAQELRRAVAEQGRPHNVIVFTNSVPSLMELVAAGISTGVLGDIYAPEDCAFHAPEFHSAFQPGLAIVGASGVVFDSTSSSGQLELYSHRAEEAAFLKQLLAGVPEVIVAVDSAKLGRRHPWSFGGTVLAGKTIRIVTDVLSHSQKEQLAQLAARLAENGTCLSFESTADCTPPRSKSNSD